MLAILVNYTSGERVGEGGPQTETLYPSTTPLILLPYLENGKSVFLIPTWKISLQLSHGGPQNFQGNATLPSCRAGARVG